MQREARMIKFMLGLNAMTKHANHVLRHMIIYNRYANLLFHATNTNSTFNVRRKGERREIGRESGKEV